MNTFPIIRTRLTSEHIMAGMGAAILLRQDFSYADFITFGVVFWGCLVVMDPVMVTSKPLTGAVAGAAAGFVAEGILLSDKSEILRMSCRKESCDEGEDCQNAFIFA